MGRAEKRPEYLVSGREFNFDRLCGLYFIRDAFHQVIMITAIVIFFASIIGVLLLALILFSILRSRQKNRHKRHLVDSEHSDRENGA